MCLKKKIGQTMKILNFFIRQLPKPRQLQHLNKIRAIGQKYPDQNEQSLKNVLKELEFRMKFIKLTYADKNFQLPKEGEQEDGNLIDDVNKQYKSQEEAPKGKKFFMKDGKLVEGEAEVRKQVDFSNWAAGNIDPDAMKKHRQLLDRQHFVGPAWQNKEMPSLSAAEYLQAANEVKKNIPYQMQRDEDKPKHKVKQNTEQNFESVKR